MDNVMKKILVIDDDIVSLTMINGILKHFYKVYPVDSGKTALKILSKQQTDLILLDWEMPEMTGIDFIKIIKADANFSNIPVIFLTALTCAASEVYAFELGAVDYLHKPVNSVVMLAKIKTHLQQGA